MITDYARGSRIWVLAAPLFLLAQGPLFGQSTSLALSSGATVLGAPVTLTLNLTVPTGNTRPAALQWTLSYAFSDVASIGVAAGTALTGAGKLLTCNPVSGSVMCIAVGQNATTISDGVVGQITVTLPSATSGPAVLISVSNAVVAFAGGTGASIASTGGSISVQGWQTPNNPAPSITTLAPSSATAGTGAFTLTVSGTGFISSSVVTWNGSPRSTTYVGTTQLQATISASDIASAGTGQVAVFNPTTGGGTSGNSIFTINPSTNNPSTNNPSTNNPSTNNPAPSITTLAPSSAAAGAGAFTLTVNGTGFISSSVVTWNGSPRSTTYVGTTQLQVAIGASDIASAGTGQVTVFNPAPGGGTSGSLGFPINGAPNLTINTTHSGNFVQGQVGTYTITVGNVGTGSTGGIVTVLDVLPTGLTATAIAGAGWACIQPFGPCTRGDLLAARASYPYITVTVNVAPNAPSLLANQVTVSGGGSAPASESDPTIVVSSAASPPAPVSSNPASGSGNTIFAFTFSDNRGWQDLGVVNILINNTSDGRLGCFLAYSRQLNVLYLAADDGTTFLPGSVLTSSGSTSNSQCTVSWTGSPVAGNGNTLVLTLGIAFNPAFAGNKVIYMAAGDVTGYGSGWQPLGVWQVPGSVPHVTTAVVRMSPSRGSGIAPTAFTFDFSDTQGFQDLGVENILVNNILNGLSACYLAYARPINVLYLTNDSGDALLPGQSLGTGGTLGNSQCTVSWGNAAVTAAGNYLTLSLNIAFSPAFGGNRIFYLAARDVNEGNNTGWQTMGTWTVQ